MEEETHKHIKRLHVYVLLLTVALFVLLWFFLSQQKGQISQPQKTAESKIKKEVRGSLSLKTRDNLRTYALGMPIVVQVLADSDKQDIVGFDVLLGYGELDLETFDVTSVTTSLPGFRVINKVQRGHLSVIAIQDPQNSTRQVFKETVILEVTLVPRKAGSQKIEIISKSDPESTKLVTAQTVALYPQVEDLTITVE